MVSDGSSDRSNSRIVASFPAILLIRTDRSDPVGETAEKLRSLIPLALFVKPDGDRAAQQPGKQGE
jgi:hypothetical protein